MRHGTTHKNATKSSPRFRSAGFIKDNMAKLAINMMSLFLLANSNNPHSPKRQQGDHAVEHTGPSPEARLPTTQQRAALPPCLSSLPESVAARNAIRVDCRDEGSKDQPLGNMWHRMICGYKARLIRPALIREPMALVGLDIMVACRSAVHNSSSIVAAIFAVSCMM